MTFSVPTTGLGQAVTDSLTSMSPLFFIAAGLVVGGSALAWGIGMLKSWRSKKG